MNGESYVGGPASGIESGRSPVQHTELVEKIPAKLVELRRLELLTSALQRQRSTN